MTFWKALSVLLVAAGLLQPSMAQDWPHGTTRIIVPFAAGSTPDSLGRLLAERWQAHFGTPFIVENRPGASGNTGTDAVAKAAPDGSTIGLSIVGPLVLNALLFKAMPYDIGRDLAALSIVAEQPSILVVSNQSGLNSLGDLVARLKRDGGSLNYGSIGYGSLSQLAIEEIALQAGAKPQHIAYTSSPAVVTALARNDVQMALLPAGSVVPQGRGGLLRMLGATGVQRSPLVAEVPTLSEGGITSADASAWVGLIAPAATPATIQQAIRDSLMALLREPGMRERLATLFLEPVGSTPEQFHAVMQQELARWKPVIAARNIRIE